MMGGDMEVKRYRYARAQVWILAYIAVAVTANVIYFVGHNSLNWW